MFSKAVLVVLASSALVWAAPTVPATSPVPVTGPKPPTPISISQCNASNASCCAQTLSASDPSTATLPGLIGVVLQGVTGLIGVDCTPISLVNVIGGTNCAQQPVCCSHVDQTGLVNLGCTPISL